MVTILIVNAITLLLRGQWLSIDPCRVHKPRYRILGLSLVRKLRCSLQDIAATRLKDGRRNYVS